MIRINLLEQGKKATATDPGTKFFAQAAAGVGVAAALAIFFVHMPLADRLDEQLADNRELDKEVKALKKKNKNFAEVEKANQALENQTEAIGALNEARAVPAWLLFELSKVLTPGQDPTMTDRMAKRVEIDDNRMWLRDWDPKNIWITGFSERKGRFKLSGGAKSDSDPTQLALRLQASKYFKRVTPEGGVEAKDRGVRYYRFTITGEVKY